MPAPAAPVPPPEHEVLSWFSTLCNWGRWGPGDVLGTLNFITPAKRAEAAGLVREGITVSCAWDIHTPARPGFAGVPPQRYALATPADSYRLLPPGYDRPRRAGAASEYLGLVFHGSAVTHLDGLSHMSWDGRLYGGRPASLVTAALGATELGIETLRDGIVTRGVLLDVAALWGREWLEPGEAVYPEHLEAAERAQGVRVGEGDAVLLRTGDGRRQPERGYEDVLRTGRAGWHAACLPWLWARRAALIGCDAGQGVLPSGYEALLDPLHEVGIVAMGLWLLDCCALEDLAAACHRLGRFEFQFVLAPLRWRGATGSPVNPLAIL